MFKLNEKQENVLAIIFSNQCLRVAVVAFVWLGLQVSFYNYGADSVFVFIIGGAFLSYIAFVIWGWGLSFCDEMKNAGNIIKFALILPVLFFVKIAAFQEIPYINDIKVDRVNKIVTDYQLVSDDIVALAGSYGASNLSTHEVNLAMQVLTDFLKKADNKAVYSKDLYKSLDMEKVDSTRALLKEDFDVRIKALKRSLKSGEHTIFKSEYAKQQAESLANSFGSFKSNFTVVSASSLRVSTADYVQLILMVVLAYLSAYMAYVSRKIYKSFKPESKKLRELF